MLKAALIGCGKIADAHVQQILRTRKARIVGVTDREPLMARQLQDRFPIDAVYDDLEELLAQQRPDVIHITTPPASHLVVAKQCLEAGCHVYVEKPFTVNEEEAVVLLRTAERVDRLATVGHNVQFARPAIEMRKLVAQGYLGGAPTHMESHYGYDLGNVSYVKALLNDADHWVRRLPGRLLQNIISHGVAKIAEFLPGDDPEVLPFAFTSAPLREIGEGAIVDELRVIIADRGAGVTAYFTFSTQARPRLHQFRVFGPANGLLTDDDQMVLLKLRGRRYKSYLEQFVPPIDFARQFMAGGLGNVYRFATRELHDDLGMKDLISAFYDAIAEHGAPPIPYREILLTTRIMDRIFGQVFPATTSRDGHGAAIPAPM